MSKIKKVLAMILSMAMILGMSLTTFAASKTSATITINNVENAALSMIQVIKADPTTETGWAFVTDNGSGAKEAYMKAFSVDEEQKAIWMLIKAENPDAQVPEGITAASASQINAALHSIKGHKPFTNGSEVSAAGIYAIRAEETGYTYNEMAAYVGFGEIKTDEGGIVNEYPSLMDVIMDAKKAPTTTTKSVDDESFYYGQILTYTIESYVPYIKADQINPTYQITDKLFRADYYLAGEKSVAKVEMEVGEEKKLLGNSEMFAVTEPGEDDIWSHSFTIDLSKYVSTANEYAGNKIIVTYTVKTNGNEITDSVWNDAASHINGEEHKADRVELHTGIITLTKWNENKTEKLANAGFKVTKKNENGDSYSQPLKFKKVSDGYYIYDPDNVEAVEEVFTGTEGKLVLIGLGLGEYHFTETTAPEGYSINQKGADAILDKKDLNKKDPSEPEGRGIVMWYYEYADITDTKLASLPSTGGIGTTIFTIGGCIIMIAAAGLYFASRKKENK